MRPLNTDPIRPTTRISVSVTLTFDPMLLEHLESLIRQAIILMFVLGQLRLH
jgi:hypothetical protein